MEDKLKILYDNLVKDNYDLPAYDIFIADMADEKKSKSLYDTLLGDNYELPDYDAFTNDLGLKKKEQSLLDLVSQGRDLATEYRTGVSQTPLEERGDQPQPLLLVKEPPKDRETTVVGDLLRSLKSGSLRALGGIAETPILINRTVQGLTIKPLMRAMGKTPEEAEQMTDAINSMGMFGRDMMAGEEAQKKLNRIAAKTESKIQPINGNIVQNIQEGNWGKAGELLGRGIVQSIPYLAMTAVTAGGGTAATLGTIGATAAGQQYGELEEKPEGKRILNSWLYGGFEAAGELVTAGLFRGVGKAFQQGIKGEINENLIKGAAKELAKGFGLESSSEAITQIGQNLTDIVTGVDPDRNILSNVLDAGLIGGFAGTGIGGANIGASALGRALASDKEVEQVSSGTQEQGVLIDQIESTESEPVKTALKDRLRILRDEADKVMDKNFELAKELSPEQKTRVAELYSTWNELQQKIDDGIVTEQELPAIENAINGVKEEIQSVKESTIAKLGEITEEEVKYKIGENKFKTKEEVELWLDKNYERRGLPPIWHEATEKLIDNWYKHNKEVILKKEAEKVMPAKAEEITPTTETGGIEDAITGGTQDQAVGEKGGTETGVGEISGLPMGDNAQDQATQEGEAGKGEVTPPTVYATDTKPEYKFLEEDLPSKKPAKKDRVDISDVEGEFRIKPIATKIKVKDEDGALANAVGKDENRPIMKGILYDAENQVKVASDAHVLTVIPTKISGKTRVIDLKTKQVIEGNFPSYTAVIPDNPNITNANLNQLLDATSGVARANDFIDAWGIGITARINYDDKSIEFDPGVLRKGLLSLAESGTENIRLELSDDATRALVIRDTDNPNKLALVMPVMAGQRVNTILTTETNTDPKLIQEALDRLDRDTPTEKYHKDRLKEAKDEDDIKYHQEKLAEIQAEKDAKRKQLEDKLVKQTQVPQEQLPTKEEPVQKIEEFTELEQPAKVEQKIEEVKNKIANNLDNLMSAIGGIQEFSGEQRTKVLNELADLAKNIGELTLLKGEELWNEVKKYLKERNIVIPQDVLDEAMGKQPQEAPKEAISAPITEKPAETPPVVETPPTVTEMGENEETRKRKIGKRVIESAEVPQDIKDALLKEGIDYIPRGRKFTQSELKEIVSVFGTTEDGLDQLAKAVYDIKNDIEGDTRVTLNAYVANEYSKLLEKSTTPQEREKYRNKVVDAFIFGQEFATKAGQTVEALKRWRELLSRDPEAIISIRKRQQTKVNEETLRGAENDIKTVKEILDSVLNTEEFKRIIESEVNKEIDKIANKKYGAVDKKKIEDFFDGLLIKNDRAFDATIGIPIAVYNGAMLTVKKAVLAGVDITNAIKQAVEYIEAWYQKNYGEGKVTSPVWNKDDYVAQMNNLLKPLSKKVKKVKFKLPKKVEDKLVDDLFAKMDVATKPQLRRLIREYIGVLEAEGAISQQRFRDLFAKAMGLDVLTPEDEQKIRETAQALNNTTRTNEKLVDKFKELVNETDATKIKQLEQEVVALKKEAQKARIQAQKAARQLAGLMAEKNTLGQTIHTLIQGNLLTITSLMSNVVGNTVFLPVRSVKSMVANGLDFMVARSAEVWTPLLNNEKWKQAHPRLKRLLMGLPTPSRSYDYFSSIRGWWIGWKEGTMEGIHQLWSGTLPEDEYQKFISQGLNPWKAFQRLRDQATGKEQKKIDTMIANFLEAFPTTYLTEAFFRGLNLGDKPFRRAAERARLEEIASLKNLSGRRREAFLNNPDPDSAEEAKKYGDVSVYQQDSLISNLFKYLNQKLSPKESSDASKRPSIIVSTFGAIFKATQAPYVKTPVNLIAEALDYSMPLLSIGRAMYYAKQGNKRQSIDYFAKAIVGYMLMRMAFFLLEEGLMTPPPDDDEKIRQAQLESKRGYSVNMSALWRRLNPFDNQRGNSEWKDDDFIVNIQRLGVFSMILMGMSKAYAQFPPEELKGNMNFIEQNIKMIPAEIGASLDQSFLVGTASGITAFNEGGPALDRWAINTSKALSAIIYPNTVAQISQVFFDDNYIREVRDMYNRDDKFKKQITNTFKDRMFMGGQLPAKVTLWGEKVNRVPEGREWPHILFDVTRSLKYQKTSFGTKMFEFYERYKFINEKEAKRILPSVPDGSNTVGWDDRNMTPQEVEELQIMVGQRRKTYVENLINSEEWQLLADEDKIDMLEKAYREAATKVKSGMFMLDIVKNHKSFFNYLDKNDFIPVPTKSVSIKIGNKKVKLSPEETADYYDEVQRRFVDRMADFGAEPITKENRDKVWEIISKQWNKAKDDAEKVWRSDKE